METTESKRPGNTGLSLDGKKAEICAALLTLSVTHLKTAKTGIFPSKWESSRLSISVPKKSILSGAMV
jgi:hypothetical protein